MNYRKKKYRVWIEQINQTYIDVTACDTKDAKYLAAMKWRRHDAQPVITDVRELTEAK